MSVSQRDPLHLLEYPPQVNHARATFQISALRLISSRPKLRSIGRLMSWDVESSELDTFAQILRKANGMRLLQDIDIV